MLFRRLSYSLIFPNFRWFILIAQPAGQIAPRDVPPQQEPQPNSLQYAPQEDDPFEIVVMVLAGEESQQLPQNNGNNDNHDNDNEHEEEEEDYEAEEEGSDNEDKDDDDYTPLSDSEKEKMYHNADEIKTSGMKL
jgi:hypothetical protein